MNSMSKQKKTTIIIVAVVVVLVIAALVCWAAFRPRALDGVKEITVNVTHTDGATRTEALKTDAQYLIEALDELELVEGEQTEYGTFVTVVDHEIADGTGGRYWVYTVNGEEAYEGVDTQPVTDGDVYDFYTIVY